jgi:chitin disaccharide deacetylase
MVGVALCADDFAISPGVSRAICEMLAQRRLFATSCLTLSRHWPEHAAWLKPFAADADLGLHLALTNFTPLSPANTLTRNGHLPGLRQILVGALTRQLPRAAIRDELQRQFDAFEAAIGRAPDYVSGHHHVHQFPGIRDIVLDLLAKRLPHPALRLADEKLPIVWRRGIARGRSAVATLLGSGCRKPAQAMGLRLNTHFAGLYDFTPQLVYRDVFRKYVDGAPAGLTIMCHPGHVDAEVAALDSTVDSRPRELAYFIGLDFPADLAAAGMSLARFTAIC